MEVTQSGRISKRKEVPFSQVSNQALRDKTFKFKGKGFICFNSKLYNYTRFYFIQTNLDKYEHWREKTHLKVLGKS